MGLLEPAPAFELFSLTQTQGSQSTQIATVKQHVGRRNKPVAHAQKQCACPSLDMYVGLRGALNYVVCPSQHISSTLKADSW